MSIQQNHTVWYIAGIGALGSVVAGLFSRAELDIRLIFKDDIELQHYNTSQITVQLGQGQFKCHPPAVSIKQLENEKIHHLICCVKAFDISPLLLSLKNSLSENSVIILIHNGLGVLDEVRKNLPHLRVISGACTIGAYREVGFSVRAFLSGKICLGPMLGSFNKFEKTEISSAFRLAGLLYEWEDDIAAKRWEKFAISCSINLLTVLFNCNNGELLLHREELKEITNEISTILQAYEVEISSRDLLLRVINVIEDTAENYSSMYIDIQNNRKTELHYLNEYLINLAQEKGIDAPVNRKKVEEFRLKTGGLTLYCPKPK